MLIKVAKSKIQGWGLSSLIGSIFAYVFLGTNVMQMIGPFKSQAACSTQVPKFTEKSEWPLKIFALTLGTQLFWKKTSNNLYLGVRVLTLICSITSIAQQISSSPYTVSDQTQQSDQDLCDTTKMAGSFLLSWILFPMLGIAGLYTIPKAYSLDIYFPDRPKLVRNLRITAI